jgi:hypothetical protein
MPSQALVTEMRMIADGRMQNAECDAERPGTVHRARCTLHVAPTMPGQNA